MARSVPATVFPTVSRRPRSRLPHERRIAVFAALTWLPGSAVALCLLWLGDYSTKVQWTLTVLIAVGVVAIALSAGLGALLARAALRPIDNITQTALAISRTEDLSRRLETGGPADEVGRLQGKRKLPSHASSRNSKTPRTRSRS